jgi:heme/copper-type cytochrome/quinol oxidase subunit 2
MPGRREPARARLAAGVLLSLVAAGAASQDDVRVEASRSGFKPKAVNLRKGETAHILLTTIDDEHCFAVDGLRVEKRIVRGKTTTLELTVDRTGTFPFHCCLEPESQAMRGRLVVTE